MPTGRLTINIMVVIAVVAFLAYVSARTSISPGAAAGEKADAVVLTLDQPIENEAVANGRKPLSATDKAAVLLAEKKPAAKSVVVDWTPASYHYILPGDVNDRVSELSAAIEQAAKKGINLGVSGPEGAFSYKVMSGALAKLEGRDMGGLRMTFVGRASDHEKLMAKASAAGLPLKYIAMP